MGQQNPQRTNAMTAPPTLTFLEIIQTQQRGEIARIGNDLHNKLTEAIRQTGVGGKLTLTFTYTVGKSGHVEIQPDLKMIEPRPGLKSGVYFQTEDGLSRSNPKQTDWVSDIESSRNRDN